MVEMRAKYGGMRYTTAQTRFDGSSYTGTTASPLRRLFKSATDLFSLVAVLGNLPGHRDVAEKLAELKARIGTGHGTALTIPHRLGAVFD
jgi:hypothetical protein